MAKRYSRKMRREAKKGGIGMSQGGKTRRHRKSRRHHRKSARKH